MTIDWTRLELERLDIDMGVDVLDGNVYEMDIVYLEDENDDDDDDICMKILGSVQARVDEGDGPYEGREVISVEIEVDEDIYETGAINPHDDFCSWDVIHTKVIEAIRHNIIMGNIKIGYADDNIILYLPDGTGGMDTKVYTVPIDIFDESQRLYYIDTEFTGLRKDTDLISVGISSPSGDVFYAELNDYDSNKVNDWIEENVIAKLAYNDIPQTMSETVNEDGTLDIYMKGTKEDVREAMVDWLERTSLPGTKWQFVCDVCQYDKMVIDDLFGGALNLPSRMCRTWIDVNDMLAEALDINVDEAFDISRVDFVKNTRVVEDEFFQQHNALNDAIIIQAIYESLTM